MSMFYIFDLIGTFAFAISGALMGAKKEMDIYGLFILGLVTGVGGGTLRDLLFGRIPPFIFNDIAYIIAVILAVLVVFFFHGKVAKGTKLLNIFDAIGLGVFTCIGATIALNENIVWYGVILSAVITSTVGGMIRDTLAGEVPFVLQKEVYASASIFGAGIFLILNMFNTPIDINIFLVSVIVTVLRLLSLHKNWSLPRNVIKNK